jgi:hypothetical protein
VEPLLLAILWLVLTAAAGVVIRHAVHRRDHRAHRARATRLPRCPTCGYAVHRLIHPRCPECGANLLLTGIER